MQLSNPGAHIGDAQTGNVGDGPVDGLAHLVGFAGCVRSDQRAELPQAHGPRLAVQPGALATGAHRVEYVINFRFGKALLTPFVFGIVVNHRIVKHLALLARERHPGAHTVRAPAVFAVVAEQTRVQLRVRGGANRAGTLGGKRQQAANVRGRQAIGHGGGQTFQRCQYMNHALAMLQRGLQGVAQRGFIGGVDQHVGHRQLDGVFLEAVYARKAGGR